MKGMWTLISKRVRKGCGLKVTITAGHGSTESISEFYDIDNLNTKQTEEARDNYEKVFITIRKLLERNEQFCCDDEADRLSLCQVISDSLRKSNLIRKEQK